MFIKNRIPDNDERNTVLFAYFYQCLLLKNQLTNGCCCNGKTDHNCIVLTSKM